MEFISILFISLNNILMYRERVSPYLSVSVSVLALLSDPVDSVEVLIGAHSRHGVLQRVHKFTGAVAVHTSCSAAAVLLIAS